MKTDNLPKILGKILKYRRKYRVNTILSKVYTKHSMRVIDIGCGIDGRSFAENVPDEWDITGVDIIPDDRVYHKHPRFNYLQMDAQNLSRFADNKFDLAVSIGMLEHITCKIAFNNIVSEIQRVAKQYIVVVPYRYCWIEPHYGVPFFPLLPYSVQTSIVKTFNLSNHRKVLNLDPSYIKKTYQWLSNAEYRKMFKNSKIYILPPYETIAIVRYGHF